MRSRLLVVAPPSVCHLVPDWDSTRLIVQPKASYAPCCALFLLVRSSCLLHHSTLCRFNSNPGMEHWKAVKHLMHYIKGTVDMKLTYSPSPLHSDEPFVSYADAD